MAYRGPELLTPNHDLAEFDCGAHDSLNHWLTRHAMQAQRSGSAQTYVVHSDRKVIGYYAIAAGSVARETATPRAAKGQPGYVPVALLGRLAVDFRHHSKGLGAALLKDALLRIANAASILGIRAVLVHAIDSSAAAFYSRYDFQPCPGQPHHLMLLMKDLKRLIGSPSIMNC